MDTATLFEPNFSTQCSGHTAGHTKLDTSSCLRYSSYCKEFCGEQLFQHGVCVCLYVVYVYVCVCVCVYMLCMCMCVCVCVSICCVCVCVCMCV